MINEKVKEIEKQLDLLIQKNKNYRKLTANTVSKYFSNFLNILGIENRTEYTFPNDPNIRKSRFDIVIIDDGKPIVIIEVKNHKRPKETPKITKQLIRYSSYGLPLLFVSDINNVKNCLNSLYKYLKTGKKDKFFIQ